MASPPGSGQPPVAPGRRDRVVHRFGLAHSPLDLGPDEGEVGPDRAVRYVPTAALVVRRSALEEAGGFDPTLRVGEDVDLVWRLVEAGLADPLRPVGRGLPSGTRSVVATSWPAASATAPRPHPWPSGIPGASPRSSSGPGPTVAAVALLAGRPATAAVAVASSAAPLARIVRPSGSRPSRPGDGVPPAPAGR